MICDRDRRMPPLIGALYDILHFRDAVHIAHLGMAVQLHPLAQAVILALGGKITDFLHAHDGADGQFTVKFVDHRDTLEFHEHARLDALADLRHLVVPGEHLDRKRVGKIRHIKDQNGTFILDFSLIQVQNLAPEGHLAHLANDVLHGNRFIFKIPSIDHIRIIRTFHRTERISILASFSLKAPKGSRLLSGKPSLSCPLPGCSVPLAVRRGARGVPDTSSGSNSRRSLIRHPVNARRAGARRLGPHSCKIGLISCIRLRAAGPFSCKRIRRACSQSGLRCRACCRDIRSRRILRPGCATADARRDFRHPSCDQAFIFFLKPPCLRLFIIKIYDHGKAAALMEHLFQNIRQFLTLSPDQGRIFQKKMHPALLRKGDLSIFEHAVEQMAVARQFQKDAVLIQFQQRFLIVLGRQAELLMDLDGHITAREKLLLDLLLHGEHIRLLDQPFAADIHADEILHPRSRHPFHPRLGEQIFSLSLQFQCRKYVKKGFCHSILPFVLTLPNAEVLPAARSEVPLPALCG